MKFKKSQLLLILLTFIIISFTSYYLGTRYIEGLSSNNNSNMNDNERNNNINNDNNNNDLNNNSKVITLPNGKTIYANSKNTVDGISKQQIPSGHEDLYILKSQIVPPVCPRCPNIINKCDDNKNKQCPPCKPCGRCPEPSYECIMKPSYKSDNSYLPVPVLANFSSFGM